MNRLKKRPNIIFVHEGFSWYLPYTLEQARNLAADSDIHLLANGYKHKGVNGATIASLESKSAGRFREAYRHMSTNPAWYELVCWLRWFHVLEYMERNDLESVLYLDSDIMLYSSFDQIYSSWGNEASDCALFVPKPQPSPFDFGIASGHASFWTVESLQEFCDFALRTFIDKSMLSIYQRYWEYHQKNKITGGVCDMTALGMFCKASKNKIMNLALAHDETMFDYNLRHAKNYCLNDYVIENSIKKVVLINNSPYVIRNGSPYSLHKAHALHFQGSAKHMIPAYSSGLTFDDKWKCDALRRWTVAKGRVASWWEASLRHPFIGTTLFK